MISGHVLELSSLLTMHPQCGKALLHQCGLSLIVRLSLDPTRLAEGIMSREVSVNWVASQGGVEAIHQRFVGWSGMATGLEDALMQWDVAFPPQELTEKAAIAVMGLVLHDFARGEIIKVLRIGSGGDYLAKILDSLGYVQVECSGILSDETGWESRSVLNKKKIQVLKKCNSGFASVTTFSHTKSGSVHSYLHQVCRAADGDQPKKTKKGRRR